MMPRPNGKAKKIAFAILGKPANLKEEDKKYNTNADRVISYQNTQRIK